jgi:hypothetical protein
VISAYLGGEDEGEVKYVELPDLKGGVENVQFFGWARWSGTSFAAARRTGRIAALIAKGACPQEALAVVRGDEGFTGRWLTRASAGALFAAWKRAGADRRRISAVGVVDSGVRAREL